LDQPTTSIDISLLYHRQTRLHYHRHTQNFVLCDINTSGKIGSKIALLRSNRGTFTHWDGLLHSGMYILIPFSTSFWNKIDQQPSPVTYTIVIHSSNQLELTVVEERITVLSECLISAVIAGCKEPKKEKDAMFYTTKKLDSIIFVAENLSRTQFLNVGTDMADAKGVQTSRNLPITSDAIPPKYRQILFVIEWTNEQTQNSTSMNYVYTYQHQYQPKGVVPALLKPVDLHQPMPIV